MSIIDTFDDLSEAVITPDKVLTKSNIKLEVIIINFSKDIMNYLVENNLVSMIDNQSIKNISQNFPIYLYKDTNIGVVKTDIGATITGGLIEEIGYVFSCKKFVIFGTCGSLDRSITEGKIIVPTSCYRDEGFSYHYLKPSDYIDMKNYQVVSRILDQLNIDYVLGKSWTTDAFYRETRNNMEKRKNEGCITVEMELSACEAVCKYYEFDLYAFLYRADNLDSSTWERGIRHKVIENHRLQYFYVAVEIAERIC